MKKKIQMREFDIEKAKAGAPVCTRDGRKARIICFNSRMEIDGAKFPIVALVENEDIGESVKMYTQDGRHDTSGSNLDLVMKTTERREGWIVVTTDNDCDCEYYGDRSIESCIYKDRKFAEDEFASIFGGVAIVKIEWEE